MIQPSNKLIGFASVFASAVCFYLATATLRWARLDGVTADSANFVFGRFFLGFVTIGILLVVKKRPPKPVNWHYLIGRTVANTMAVYCFFKAVDLTSVAEGNILNMTYPLFVALVSWFTLKDERNRTAIFVVLIAFAGVMMILAPDMARSGLFAHFNPNALWGLASGLSASVAIIYLNLSRRVHSTETTLFFMFAMGCVILFLLFKERITWPDRQAFFFIALCSVVSVMGQVFITFGFRFVTAVEGSIISSSRILLAALLGPIIAAEPALPPLGWLGAFLIFSGNVYLALAPKKSMPPAAR